jgi:hypothetical protein
MKSAKLIKKVGFYSIISQNAMLWTLADFLRTEVKNDVLWYKEFVFDNKRLGIGGDSVSVEKDDDNPDLLIIDMEWHYCDETCLGRVVMHKDEFLKMLNRWEQVYPQKPDEIIITQDDDGNISITGKFADGREI